MTDNCCNFLHGASPNELFDAMPQSHKDIKTMRSVINRYTYLDSVFLYIVVIANVMTIVGTLASSLSVENDNCKNMSRSAGNVIIWMSSFALVTTSIRLYFFKMYLQQPIFSLISMAEPDVYDKFMNICVYLFALGLVALFVAMFSFVQHGDNTHGLILMSAVIALSLFTTFWYKLLVRRNLRIAKRFIENTSHKLDPL
jgi:hypothetical protein